MDAKVQQGKSVDFGMLKGHFIECATDQYWSRFMQQKCEECSEQELDVLFTEILPQSAELMKDVFGNYIIQKLFKYGSGQMRQVLADQLLGNVLDMSRHMYGCRVV